ncbi:hypothetical protein PVAG01_09053 [Phlyctema vagabunda]|uniref:Uncharacterized protein n=1 Tax=Phlyctema vagabunda TaxID=108571 RepID=A0ABR4P694_9HELO
MLQRNSPKRLSLGRRKSTSSVQHKHEPIDPEISRQQAQTAATLAFARANARKSTDSGISRNNSTATNRDRQPLSRQNSTASENEPSAIRRQHSVRFAGPHAVPRRQAIAKRSSQHSVAPQGSSGNLRPRAVTTDAPVPAQYRPPSRSSSIGKASIGKGTSASYVTAVAYDEYYTKEDDVASTPSSYRRIRKSKSMFSPLQAPAVYYSNGTPDSRVTREDSFVDQSPKSLYLRTPRSMSFLRGGRDHILPGTRQRNDAAVQMARDKFLHNVEQQRLKAQPSFLFRSRRAREEKPFKKSLRSSSNGYGVSVGSNNSTPAPKESGFKVKARRASAKIKNKLKRVFGKEPKENVVIPDQQVEALGTHVQKYNGNSNHMHGNSMEFPQSDDPTVSEVTSRMPSIHAVASDQQLRSSSASMRSMRSEAQSDKSRVTSWATTTNNNTISSLTRAQNEAERREQQRLSIINEYGTHHTSATFARRPVANQTAAHSTSITSKSGNVMVHTTPPVSTTVDSARVYSALMKRLDENSPKAKLEAQRKSSVDSFISPKKVPPRSSSVDRKKRNSSRSRGPPTIRRVPSDFKLGDDDQSSNSGGSVRRHPQRSSSREKYDERLQGSSMQERAWPIPRPGDGSGIREYDDVFSPDHRVHEATSYDSRDSSQVYQTSSQNHQHKKTAKPHDGESQYSSQLSLDQRLSPQAQATGDEPIVAEKTRKPLRDSRSTYFGSDAVTLRKTTSPYRRALAEKDYNPPVVTGNTPVRTSPLRNRPRLLSAGKENVNPDSPVRGDVERGTYTESIYSRTTSGQTPTASNSNLVLPMSQHPGMTIAKVGTGDAVILERATYKPTHPGSGYRKTPSISANDWQGWMSDQIAVFEQDQNEDSVNTVIYALPSAPTSAPHTGAHVREKAQIYDDESDDSDDQRFSTVSELRGPLKHSIQISHTGPTEDAIAHVEEPAKITYMAGEMPQRNISNFINQLYMQNGPSRQNEKNSGVNREASSEHAPKQQPLPLKPILKKPSTVSLAEARSSTVPTPPPMPPRSPLKQMQRGSTGSRTPSVKSYNFGEGSTRGRERNVLHKRNTSQSTLRSIKTPSGAGENMKGNGSQATLRTIDTPAKLVKKNGLASTATGSIRSQKIRDHENVRVEVREFDALGTGAAGPTGSTSLEAYDAQQVGSKRMVDLFLSNRRRHITGSSEESSGRSEGVFL